MALPELLNHADNTSLFLKTAEIASTSLKGCWLFKDRLSSSSSSSSSIKIKISGDTTLPTSKPYGVANFRVCIRYFP
jgi:hypothetical protein